MLRGFLAAGGSDNFTVIKPSPLNIKNVKHFPSAAQGAQSLKSAEIIFLAVKPQIMREVITDAKPYIPETALLISIAAGIKTAQYEQTFPNSPIIRTLPNTPSAVGKGMNLLIANPAVTDAQKSTTTRLFESLGKTHWLNDENDMDAASAISASGPAYLFYFIEVLAKAGENMNLPPDIAMTLARQTIIGAAALAENDADTQAAQLRANVTSAKGMTAAALEIFMDGRIQDIYNEALTAAKNRSRELGK